MTLDSVFRQPEPECGNICAVVVSYCPEGDLLGRLRAIRPQVGSLVVVDNGSFGESVERLRTAESGLGVEVVRNGCNRGLAAALNQGARWAEGCGCAWMLTLDQDTVVGDDLVQTLSGVYREFPDREKLAVIGSNYTDPVRGPEFAAFCETEGRSWHDARAVITSGSLISLSVFREVGSFRNEFFLDCVDFEYCLRARSKGFRVIASAKPLMKHPVGSVTLHKLPWKTTQTTNHSALRRYYMARNQVVLVREYLWGEPRWILWMLYRQLKAIILMCLFEEDTSRKLRYTGLGTFDGLFSNFGRNLVDSSADVTES